MPEQGSAAPSAADTIRAALQGAMVGAWGRENALRALAELEADRDRLAMALERIARGAEANPAHEISEIAWAALRHD